MRTPRTLILGGSLEELVMSSHPNRFAGQNKPFPQPASPNWRQNRIRISDNELFAQDTVAARLCHARIQDS